MFDRKGNGPWTWLGHDSINTDLQPVGGNVVHVDGSGKWYPKQEWVYMYYSGGADQDRFFVPLAPDISGAQYPFPGPLTVGMRLPRRN